MRKNLILRLIPALCVVLGLGAFADGQIADAASSQNITMTPSSTQLSVAPGGTVQGSLDVINEGDTPFNVALSSSPYYVQGLDYDPHFTQLPGTVNASEWVHFSTPITQLVDPHKLVDVNYSLTAPEGTPAGGYYAVLFAETSPTSNGTGVVAHNRVGDILYITVEGKVKTSGTLTAESLPFVTTAAHISVGMIVGNTGGVHYITTAKTQIKNLFGMTVYTNTADRYVLPQTAREITSTWSPTSVFGIYKVSRSATVAGTTKTLADTWVVVVQPWILWVIGAVIVLLIARIIARVIIRNRRP